MVEPGAEKLDELADHTLLAQHLGDGQHQVRGGRTFLHPTGQLESDDLRNQHRDGLPEHRRLRFDAAYTPPEHGQAVDHRRVAVGADQRVRVSDRDAIVLAGPDDLGEIFEIDLVVPVPGGTTRKLSNAAWPQRRN